MFQAERFLGSALAPRTRAVPVPDLAAWFDGPAVWTVRGLNANELARVERAERTREQAQAVADALQSGSAAEITASVRDLLGRGDAVEAIYARQIEILVVGSVEPAIEHSIAAKLGESYPVAFKQLVNAILELTGLGSEAEKKPATSTATISSGPASPSDGDSSG